MRRYITVLYYLNDVEGGGETAFPVADDMRFNETVSNMMNRCGISPAILWLHVCYPFDVTFRFICVRCWMKLMVNFCYCARYVFSFAYFWPELNNRALKFSKKSNLPFLYCFDRNLEIANKETATIWGSSAKLQISWLSRKRAKPSCGTTSSKMGRQVKKKKRKKTSRTPLRANKETHISHLHADQAYTILTSQWPSVLKQRLKYGLEFLLCFVVDKFPGCDSGEGPNDLAFAKTRYIFRLFYGPVNTIKQEKYLSVCFMLNEKKIRRNVRAHNENRWSCISVICSVMLLGWMGPRDDNSLHGGCVVTKGTKFIANNWIPAPEPDTANLDSDYLDETEIERLEKLHREAVSRDGDNAGDWACVKKKVK